MFVGNGVTTEFPLPSGVDGSDVWISGPEGSEYAVKLKNPDSYVVVNGAVVFETPPPSGWRISFAKPENTAVPPEGAVTVIYPDGTMRLVERNPWELLVEAKAERQNAVNLLIESRALLESAKSQVFNASAEAKEISQSRLTDFTLRAETVIAAAVNAVKKDVMEAVKVSVAMVDARAERAQQFLGVAADTEARMQQALNDVNKVASGVQAAATLAAGTIITEFGARSDAIMTELKASKAAVDDEISDSLSTLRDQCEKFRDEALLARDGAISAVLDAEAIKGRILECEERISVVRGAVETVDARVQRFNGNFSARMREMRAEAKKGG